MRSTEAEKVLKKNLNCLILYFHESLEELQTKPIHYIYIYISPCMLLPVTHTLLGRSAYTQQGWKDSKAMHVSETVTWDLLVQTWFADVTRCDACLTAPLQLHDVYEAEQAHIAFLLKTKPVSGIWQRAEAELTLS